MTVGVHNLPELWLAGSVSMLDRSKVLVRRAAIQRRVRPKAVVEELVLKEFWRDGGTISRTL